METNYANLYYKGEKEMKIFSHPNISYPPAFLSLRLTLNSYPTHLNLLLSSDKRSRSETDGNYLHLPLRCLPSPFFLTDDPAHTHTHPANPRMPTPTPVTPILLARQSRRFVPTPPCLLCDNRRASSTSRESRCLLDADCGVRGYNIDWKPISK